MSHLVLRSLSIGVAALALGGQPALAQPGNPGQNFAKPVLEEAYPIQIKASTQPGNLKILIYGKNLEVDPGNNLWNNREQFLYVRHSAQGNEWHNLYNNARGPEGYPNGDMAAGSVNFVWAQQVIAELPIARWASTPGYLEFKFVKGQLIPDRDQGFVFKPKAESAVLRVPVKKDVGETSRITFVSPDSYLVNEQIAPLLTVQGRWAPGSVVLLDGKPMAMHPVNSLEEIQADLPPGFLSKAGRHTLVIRDPQPSLGYTRDLWVNGGPKIEKTQPKIVKVDTGAFNLVATCDTSLTPDTIEGRVTYIVSAGASAAASAAKPASQAVIPPKNRMLGRQPVNVTPAAASAPPAASANAQAELWTTLAFQVKGKDLWIKIPADWAKQEGTIRIRVTTKAGQAEVSVPIK